MTGFEQAGDGEEEKNKGSSGKGIGADADLGVAAAMGTSASMMKQAGRRGRSAIRRRGLDLNHCPLPT